MAGFNAEFLNEHKLFRKRNTKVWLLFPLLAIVVAIIVFWCLKLVGITVTSEALCGMDAHRHEESCYEMSLICEEEHEHSDTCYESNVVCKKIEHTHTSDCFPQKAKDTETSKEWKESFSWVSLTNDVSENLISIACTQVGYSESKHNFEYDAAGVKQGYTRYGEWYGSPYADWNTLFVSFCLNYANANNVDGLLNASAESARLAWQKRGDYAAADGYNGERGDIVFFDVNSDGKADRVGILLHRGDGWVHVIEGDVDGVVKQKDYDTDSNILGYGKTSEVFAAQQKSASGGSPQENTPAEEELAGEVTYYIPKTNGTYQILNRKALKSMPSADHEIVYTSHLGEELVNAVIKTMDGDVIQSGDTIYMGESYVVELEFSEINKGSEWVQFRHNDDDRGYLTYQIPSNLNVVPFEEWHPITAKTENGTIENVGEYFIDENGLLRVHFYYDEDKQMNFLDEFSNVDFTIDFNTTVAANKDGSSAEITFNNDVSVNLGVDESVSAEVKKSHSAYNGETHTIEYSVEFRVLHGLLKDAVVDDAIWDSHHVLRDTIVITDLNGVPFDPQPTIEDHPEHKYGATGGFRITGLPDLPAGEGFRIVYQSSINDDSLHNETVDVWNGVTVSGKNPNGNDESFYGDDWERIQMERLDKEGKQTTLTDADGNRISVIQWQVVIKKSDVISHEGVVIDTLGEGLEYYRDKPIEVTVYDQYMNPVGTTNISWDEVEVVGDSIKFYLPDGHAFNIQYYTTYEDLEESDVKKYNNSVHVHLNGHDHETSGSANVIGFVPEVHKSAAGEDGEYVYFTIEADVPAAIKNMGHFYIEDTTAFWGPGLYVENFPQDLVVKAVTESGQTIELTPYQTGGTVENTYLLDSPAEGKRYHTFKLYFNTDTPENESSKWILDENATLTITYKLPFDAKTGENWDGPLTGDQTMKDVLLDGNRLDNDAWLTFAEGISVSDVASYEYAPKLVKDSMTYDDGQIDYSVVFNNTVPGSNGQEGYINGTVDKVWFTDTFDERLEYVADSLIVTCYSPWIKDLWLMKYQYNGEITGNTINAYAEDFVFFDFNEDANSSGANYDWLLSTKNLRDYYLWVNAGGKYVFNYSLQVKDEYLNTTEKAILEFANTAELVWDEDGSSGPATDTAQLKTGLLDKSMVQKDSELEFTVEINRNVLDMMPDADTLTVVDTMKDNMSVYWESIKVYYHTHDGDWIDFDSDESQYTCTVTFNPPTNELTFVIPDSLHIKIVYTTLITESGRVNVHNSVRVDGKSDVMDSTDAYFQVMEHSGDASGSNNSILLLKQDALTNEPLSGAAFALYGPMGDPNAKAPSGVAQNLAVSDTKNLGYIATYTTGADGTVEIKNQYLTVGGPYALVEITAPEDYEILTEPAFFYYYEPDPDGFVQTVTTLVVVENTQLNVIIPETGGSGHLPVAIIGVTLAVLPVLYSSIRRKRERRLK